MSKGKVYLAGVISGFNYAEANDWREDAKKELEKWDIVAASPMRWKDHLGREDKLDVMGYASDVMSNTRGITTRDRWDVKTADVVIANLLNTKIASIGTCLEMAWADLQRTPIIAIMEPEGNPHEHAMLSEIISYRVETVEQALEVAKKILVC